MFPELNLQWTSFDEVFDGQWVGVHEVWMPFPQYTDMLQMYKTTAPTYPKDTIFGVWMISPMSLYIKELPLPARFLTGEATRCFFDDRPFWRVADKYIPITAGPIPFLVVTTGERISA